MSDRGSAGRFTSGNSRRFRPNGTPLPDPLRDRLKQAICAYEETSAQVNALEQAQLRAEDEARENRHKLALAEADLGDLRKVEPADIAWSFALNETLERGQSLAEAQAAVDLAKAQCEHSDEIVQAIDGEVATLNGRLSIRRSNVYAAAAEVVAVSAELDKLFIRIERAWQELRRVQQAFYTIENKLSNNLPDKLSKRWQRVPPFDPSSVFPDYPVDKSLAERWGKALDGLLLDGTLAVEDQ
jgi:hypothetical protein